MISHVIRICMYEMPCYTMKLTFLAMKCMTCYDIYDNEEFSDAEPVSTIMNDVMYESLWMHVI